ncbi:MAG: hypothetical protein L6437_08235 [Kiritimatiellae bacterium]|nr:hypothetical protein [Kiritimatiellia bacterium]
MRKVNSFVVRPACTHLGICGVSIMVLCAFLTGGAYGAKKPSVGILSSEAEKYSVEHKYSPSYKFLQDNGMESSLVEWRKVQSPEKIYERLKKFNAIIWYAGCMGGSIGEGESHRFTPEMRDRANVRLEALLKYVSQGGGLFIIVEGQRYAGKAVEEYLNVILKGIGAQIIHEGIYDKEHTFISAPAPVVGKWEYFYTTNVEPHPVTKGVKMLYLPKLRGSEPGVQAVEYDKNWKVIIRGEKSCRGYFVGHDNMLNTSKPGKYESAPPIVAVRTLGKGRIFAYSISYRHVIANYDNPAWQAITESEGDSLKGIPSHGNVLLANSLKWLAEPSLSIDGFGTYKPKAVRPVQFPKSVNWDERSFRVPDKDFTYPDGQKLNFIPISKGVRGLIGVHTELTDGKGSIKDFADAAKKVGLSFIVFNEPLEMLTKDEFETLKKDCASLSDDAFYACPGIEFTDSLGNRWAVWGENVVFPSSTFEFRNKTYPLWDGKCIHHTGKYADLCQFVPNALLDYRTLKKAGGHPENMWWFFRICPFVYEGTKLVADNFSEYLFSLRDLRWMDIASFTRIRKPSEVAAVASTCVTVASSLKQANEWLNTRANSYGHQAKPYVTQGPEILCWEAINKQMENYWEKTSGAQRIKLKFIVASDAGIKDVKVHDANYGIIRRFAGNGEKRFEKEFELVHDKQHYVVLEVTDNNGKRAISRYQLIFCYKSGLHRCGDNLNTLGSAAVCWHPDRNEMVALAKSFQDSWKISLAGFDSASGVCPQPQIVPQDEVYTTEGAYTDHYRKNRTIGKILDVKQGSYDIQICQMAMDHFTEGYGGGERVPSAAIASISKDRGPMELYERVHTAYTLRSRLNYFITWNYRRAHEGSTQYRGGIVWHEGKIKFKKDVTLGKRAVPIELFFFDGPGGVPQRMHDHLFVTDRERGTLGIALLPKDKEFSIKGRIRPGGYLAAMPTPSGYLAFLSSSDSDFCYDAQEWNKKLAKFDRIYIGLGQGGQKIKAGTEIPYRFMIATINDHMLSNQLLEDMVKAYNLDGGTDGYPFDIKIGKLLSAEFFFTVQAKDNETLFDIGPRSLICDLAFRVKGIEDNGCAAVYNHSKKYFRFVAVTDGTAYFQESIEKPAKIWVGNPFVCTDKRLKLTLVIDGQAEGSPPFIEIHNPTDKAVDTKVYSPENTPMFGGISTQVTVPAGDSLWLLIRDRVLVPNPKTQDHPGDNHDDKNQSDATSGTNHETHTPLHPRMDFRHAVHG